MSKRSKIQKASIRQIQHNLKHYIACVQDGEEIVVIKAGKSVAKLSYYSEPATKPFRLPDFAARLKKSFPKGPIENLNITEIISQSRD